MMEATGLAREVAAAFEMKFKGLGHEVAKASQSSAAPRPQATRSLDILTHTAEMASIGHFVLAMTPIVLAAWSRPRDRGAVKTEVAKSITTPTPLNTETAEQMIDVAIDKVERSA
jgi:hypothetical protein